jgi:hypothetical protein
MLGYIALALPCRLNCLSEPGPCHSFCRAQAFCWCVAGTDTGTGTPSVCRRPNRSLRPSHVTVQTGAGVGLRESREGWAVSGGLVAVVVVVVVGSWQSFDSGAVDPPQEGQVISGLYDVYLAVRPVNMYAYQACLCVR